MDKRINHKVGPAKYVGSFRTRQRGSKRASFDIAAKVCLHTSTLEKYLYLLGSYDDGQLLPVKLPAFIRYLTKLDGYLSSSSG